jgi:hypothetical protein
VYNWGFGVRRYGYCYYSDNYYYTASSIWIKESNNRHQIVGFLRFTSSVNSLEQPVTSTIKPLGAHQSQLISAEYELLDMTFRPSQAKGVWII